MANQAVATRTESHWGWYLGYGIISILLGWLILAKPAETIISLVVLLGFYLLVGGIVTTLISFMGIGEKGSLWGWRLVSGIFSVIAGLVVLNNPLFSSVLTPVMFTYIVAFSLVINGIVDMAVGRDAQKTGERDWTWGAFALGALYLILGLFLLGAPTNYAVATVVTVTGWAIIGVGLANVVVSFLIKKES